MTPTITRFEALIAKLAELAGGTGARAVSTRAKVIRCITAAGITDNETAAAIIAAATRRKEEIACSKAAHIREMNAISDEAAIAFADPATCEQVIADVRRDRLTRPCADCGKPGRGFRCIACQSLMIGRADNARRGGVEAATVAQGGE